MSFLGRLEIDEFHWFVFQPVSCQSPSRAAFKTFEATKRSDLLTFGCSHVGPIFQSRFQQVHLVVPGPLGERKGSAAIEGQNL